METKDYYTFNAEKARCVFFANQIAGEKNRSGQQVRCWLPAGTYKFCGFETIEVSDRGEIKEIEMARLEHGINHVYYVAPCFLQEG